MFKLHLKGHRKIELMLSGLVVAGVLAGCGAAGHQLTVSTYGSNVEWRRKLVVDPFQKKSKLQINPDFSNNPARFTKLEKSYGKGLDIAEITQLNTIQGREKGNVFKKINPSKISNYKDLTPAAKQVAKQTGGVPYATTSCGILYNKKKLGKISSWKQLWTNKKLRGKLAVPPMEQTNGPAFLAIAGEVAGTPIEKDNGKAAAFSKMKELKPQLIGNWDPSTIPDEMKKDEVLANVTSEFAVPKLLKNDKDLAYVVPKGSFSSYDVASVTKGSKSLKNDYKFLNYRISKGLQTKAAKNKTYGKNAKHTRNLNYKFVAKHLDSWISKWDHIIGE